MDDIIINKTQSIERCLKRIHEEFQAAGDSFYENYTRQDAAILNLTRACEQTIDLANHIVKIKKLGIPSSSRESFKILADNKIISTTLAENLMKMTGFRNTVIDMYQEIDIQIVITIIKKHLSHFTDFTHLLLTK